jgi:hypothetical protein
MAGRKQHYDPHFLLKGFESKRKGDTVFVWYFRKDAAPREVSTRDIGHSPFFYGKPGVRGDGSLDTLITDKETEKYAVVVNRVRQDRKINPSDRDTLVEFVYFQSARTRSTREQYRSSLVSSVERLRKKYGNLDGMMKLMQDIVNPDDEEFLKLLKEKLEEKGVKLPDKVRKVLMRQYLLKHGDELIKKEAPTQILIANLLASTVLKKSKKLIKEGHNQGLEQLIRTDPTNPVPGLNQYLQLHWDVRSLGNRSLIFGDAAVLYREENSSHLFAGLGKGDLVLLPLSHDLLLFGAVNPALRLPSPDEITRNSAELSLYFFVSSLHSRREDEYHKLIGKKAPTVEEEAQ